jgi:hypothetical protein
VRHCQDRICSDSRQETRRIAVTLRSCRIIAQKRSAGTDDATDAVRRMWSRTGYYVTEPADTAHGLRKLLKGCEAQFVPPAPSFHGQKWAKAYLLPLLRPPRCVTTRQDQASSLLAKIFAILLPLASGRGSLSEQLSNRKFLSVIAAFLVICIVISPRSVVVGN